MSENQWLFRASAEDVFAILTTAGPTAAGHSIHHSVGARPAGDRRHHHGRAVRTAAPPAAQTRAALEERAVTERAKGVIAYSENLPVDAAFDRLITLARSEGHPLTAFAAEVVDQAAEHRH